MKKFILLMAFTFFSTMAYSQVGHVMQGVGAFNMSMGGAATGQPLDISGALQWNPAAISSFDQQILNVDVGLFFSSPELNSTVPEFDQNGQPTGNYFSGTTADDRGISPMPAVAYVWASEKSKHSFGLSVFGISGFGVTFPENMANPINMPQNMGGFGHIESDYMLLQTGITYAYQLSDKFSIGVEPNFSLSSLELAPNPTASPSQTAGYPSTNKATATGYGAQVGLFFDSGSGFKSGIAYKTNVHFSDFEFENTYLDGSTSTNSFNMDYPSIFSVGLGYSADVLDLALDYRFVNYENTDGFSESGWTNTASVAGFGWKNISVISTGIQYKGIDNLPLRLGYTYSSNPIDEELTFFNIPATAVIANAFQVGAGYNIGNKINFDIVYHRGMSAGKTSGPVLNPQLAQQYPNGAIPGSEISYDMNTDLIMVGFKYLFSSK
ncbi:OmpP1/FadL family transporter [Gracilimonas sp. Q87]|uniref:OmpP1/FadL family transporter n=1 Tax=Gracilimonas sp. Q87 TaxID=3384766 RepID=UPI0039841316